MTTTDTQERARPAPAVGARPRAMGALEWQMHGQAVRAYNRGLTEDAFLTEKGAWGKVKPDVAVPNAGTGSRLSQVVANLREQGKWPWTGEAEETADTGAGMTVPEAAVAMGVTEQQIRKYIYNGRLPARRVGKPPRGMYLVRREDVAALKARHEDRQRRLAERDAEEG